MSQTETTKKRYVVELDENGYIELIKLALKNTDDISLLTRTCLIYAKEASEVASDDKLARAYDDGFTACAYEHTKRRDDPSYPITRVNPYKAHAND